jgi:thiol-disulfide isomerase/thioredoxin
VKSDEPKGPAKKASGYAKYFPKIDEGKKILCFFAPTCEHCMQTGKELTELRKADPTFPEVQIVFMDEAPEEIPAFFKFAGAEYKNYVMDIVAFWTALGNNKDTPGVVYLWNGNTMKFYNGTEGKDKFNKAELKKLVKKETY